MIELARMLSTSKLKNNNYLFVAFSGEELGLFGQNTSWNIHPSIQSPSTT